MLDSAIAEHFPKDCDFETRKERRDLRPNSAKVELRSLGSRNADLTGWRQRCTTGGVAVDCTAPWRPFAVAGAAGRAAGGFVGVPDRGVAAVGLGSAGAPAAVGGGASSDGSTVSF
jgi:hypothetical protein